MMDEGVMRKSGKPVKVFTTLINVQQEKLRLQ